MESPRWREFGILNVDAVKLKGQKLTLRCTRRGIVRDGTGRTAFYGQPTKIIIDVDLQGADPKQALPGIRDALFFPSLEDARAAIPKPLQEWIPFRIDAPRRAVKTAMAKPCDCAHRDATGTASEAAGGMLRRTQAADRPCAATPRAVRSLQWVSAHAQPP